MPHYDVLGLSARRGPTIFTGLMTLRKVVLKVSAPPAYTSLGLIVTIAVRSTLST